MTSQTEKKNINPLVTAVGGVVVGVGLAVAGVIALKDKATNKKVEDGIDDLKERSDKASKEVAKKAKSTKQEIINTVNRTKGTAKKMLEDIAKE